MLFRYHCGLWTSSVHDMIEWTSGEGPSKVIFSGIQKEKGRRKGEKRLRFYIIQISKNFLHHCLKMFNLIQLIINFYNNNIIFSYHKILHSHLHDTHSHNNYTNSLPSPIHPFPAPMTDCRTHGVQKEVRYSLK